MEELIKTKRVTLGMILGATVLAVTAFTNVDAVPSTSYTAPLVDLPVTTWFGCGECQNCPAGYHAYVDLPWGGDWDGVGEPSHTCKDEDWSLGSCPFKHGPCLGSGPFATLTEHESEQLWAMVTKDTTPDLAAALSEFGEAVSYHATRGAVQVQGCDGAIIVSIPLSSAQVDRLSE